MNNSPERRFDEEQEKLTAEYRATDMTEDQIEQMYQGHSTVDAGSVSIRQRHGSVIVQSAPDSRRGHNSGGGDKYIFEGAQKIVGYIAHIHPVQRGFLQHSFDHIRIAAFHVPQDQIPGISGRDIHFSCVKGGGIGIRCGIGLLYRSDVRNEREIIEQYIQIQHLIFFHYSSNSVIILSKI